MDKKISSLNTMEDDSQAYPLAWPIYPIEEIQTYFADEAFQKEY